MERPGEGGAARVCWPLCVCVLGRGYSGMDKGKGSLNFLGWCCSASIVSSLVWPGWILMPVHSQLLTNILGGGICLLLQRPWMGKGEHRSVFSSCPLAPHMHCLMQLRTAWLLWLRRNSAESPCNCKGFGGGEHHSCGSLFCTAWCSAALPRSYVQEGAGQELPLSWQRLPVWGGRVFWCPLTVGAPYSCPALVMRLVSKPFGSSLRWCFGLFDFSFCLLVSTMLECSKYFPFQQEYIVLLLADCVSEHFFITHLFPFYYKSTLKWEMHSVLVIFPPKVLWITCECTPSFVNDCLCWILKANSSDISRFENNGKIIPWNFKNNSVAMVLWEFPY